jgi:hypothetical protein
MAPLITKGITQHNFTKREPVSTQKGINLSTETHCYQPEGIRNVPPGSPYEVVGTTTTLEPINGYGKKVYHTSADGSQYIAKIGISKNRDGFVNTLKYRANTKAPWQLLAYDSPALSYTTTRGIKFPNKFYPEFLLKHITSYPLAIKDGFQGFKNLPGLTKGKQQEIKAFVENILKVK